MAAFLGVPIEALYGEYRAFADQVPERIDWSDYVRIKEITARVAGSDARMVALGRTVIQTPRTALGAQAMALFVDPELLLLKASKNGWCRLFSNIDVTCAREGERVRIEVRLHPGYEPCRPFFVQNAGILQEAPTLVGCKPAEVEWSTDGYSGVYLVKVPPSNTLWSRLKRQLRVLGNTQVTIQELTDQQERLNKQNGELQEALSNARAALATRDRFLQTIDHELRTPLNGIRGGISALRAASSPAERQQWLEIVDRSEARLGELIQSILDYSRLESERLTVRPREFKPSFLGRDLEREALRLEPHGQIELELRVPDDLWLEGDDEQIAKVTLELLRNALRFAPGTPARVTVSLAGEGDARGLRFEVADSGPGIGVEDRERIFEPFVQLHRGECRDFGGSGLGLAIARALTRSMNGTLELRSRPGEGSTFTAEFPVKIAGERSGDTPRELSVLLVDDDKVNRLVATRMLRQLGCEVQIAEDGLQAMEQLARGVPDLVLMDCEMPNLDGWATTRKLRREISATLPVVALTAYTSEEDRRRCTGAGMNDFLSKPLTRGALQAVLERWISRRATRSAA